MHVPVIVEKRSDGRVRVSGPLGWEAEGDSVSEAKETLRLRIQAAFEHDVMLDTLDIDAPAPLDSFFGDLKDDPLFGEWQEAIRAYREERQAE